MPRGRWVIASLVPFGWVTWAGFLYAGLKARKGAWVAFAAAYALAAAGAITITELDEDIDELDDTLGYLLMFGTYAVGIVHSFVARKEYLRRIAILEDPALEQARLSEERRAFAHELARSDPELARTAGLGRRGGFEEAGLVDVNHAPVEDIADLPQVSGALAREIVAAREHLDGFSSLEDLGMALDLPGDLVEDLRGHVVFLPR
jgi:hypothetical protein